MNRLLLLLVLWEARAGAARPRFPQDKPCHPEGWRRDSVGRKREVVLSLLRGESAEDLSRELGVSSYRLERWRERALSGIDGSLREREGDAVSEELAAAMKRIGELTMENEVLRMRVEHVGTLDRRRSR